MVKLNSPSELEKLRQSIIAGRDAKKPRIAVCGGTGCHALGSQNIASAFEKEIEKRSLKGKVDISETGCHGFCEKGPGVIIYPEGVCYLQVRPEDTHEIISQTIIGKKVIDRLVYTDPKTGAKAVHESEIPFYKHQTRLVIGDNGKINPKSIEDYLAIGGYSALSKIISGMSPEQVIDEIKKSNLRGRSGAGFPVGRKWEACRKAEGDIKYLVCNCHEGDPGAFADRRMIEANPHSILEGMLIGAYATGAREGCIFIGDEFPITVENTEIAIEQAQECGLLGKNILGSGMDLDIKINIDAGNYVCGEMSALIAAIEGRVAEPVVRYDHTTERGLWDKPTVVNNLQSWAYAPLIINRGADWLNTIGTERSKGTRVFSLAGTVNHIGLIEVPMGMSLRQVIYDVGGGIPDDSKLKAVIIGGPLGALVPESLMDIKVDFDEFTRAGGSLGPGLIVMDDKTCIVDTVKYFINFLTRESCGKCTPCREGLKQMLKIMDRISQGMGKEEDIGTLEALIEIQRPTSLCGLGQTASNPAVSALKHFRAEIEAHIKEKHCPAGVCKMLAPVSE